MKRILALLLCLCLPCASACAGAGETRILLGDDTILVDGAPITADKNQAVRLESRTETHEDVPEEYEGIANRVIAITEGGVYRVSGSAADAQLTVRAGSEDAVRIILDGASITCRTAPAIVVYSAADPGAAGEYAVTIELAPGSENSVIGAHTESDDEDETDLSGAVTSLVSLGFEGEGSLNVQGDNEGIEVKYGHLSYNGGSITVNSGDDALNASEDNVSVITINGGSLRLRVNPEAGGEGDGMDSNGSIVINGGTVASWAHPDSMDSGIDSDLGCTVNGGTVLSAGNMYDEITGDSGQLFMALQFSEKTDQMIVVLDAEGNVAAVCSPEDAYTSFVLSSPELAEGDYTLWLGGELTRENGETLYLGGTQLQHGGAAGGMSRPGDGGARGFKPGDMPAMPDGVPGFPGGKPGERPGGMPDMPAEAPGMRGGRPGEFPGGMTAGESGEASDVFHLASGSTLFSAVRPVE